MLWCLLFSALCTTDGKLVSQYLVVEHMAAHYKKLNEAKCKYCPQLSVLNYYAVLNNQLTLLSY